MTQIVHRALAQETLYEQVHRGTRTMASLKPANYGATSAATAPKSRMKGDYFHSARPGDTAGPRVVSLT